MHTNGVLHTQTIGAVIHCYCFSTDLQNSVFVLLQISVVVLSPFVRSQSGNTSINKLCKIATTLQTHAKSSRCLIRLSARNNNYFVGPNSREMLGDN